MRKPLSALCFMPFVVQNLKVTKEVLLVPSGFVNYFEIVGYCYLFFFDFFIMSPIQIIKTII
jgi:hypothetical protein